MSQELSPQDLQRWNAIIDQILCMIKSPGRLPAGRMEADELKQLKDSGDFNVFSLGLLFTLAENDLDENSKGLARDFAFEGYEIMAQAGHRQSMSALAILHDKDGNIGQALVWAERARNAGLENDGILAGIEGKKAHLEKFYASVDQMVDMIKEKNPQKHFLAAGNAQRVRTSDTLTWKWIYMSQVCEAAPHGEEAAKLKLACYESLSEAGEARAMRNAAFTHYGRHLVGQAGALEKAFNWAVRAHRAGDDVIVKKDIVNQYKAEMNKPR